MYYIISPSLEKLKDHVMDVSNNTKLKYLLLPNQSFQASRQGPGNVWTVGQWCTKDIFALN